MQKFKTNQMTISSAISSASSRLITFPIYRQKLAPASISVRFPSSSTTLWLSSPSTCKKTGAVACLKQKQDNVQEQDKTKEEVEATKAEMKKKLLDLVLIVLALIVSVYLMKLTDSYVHFAAVFTVLWKLLIEKKSCYKENKWIIDVIKDLYALCKFIIGLYVKLIEGKKKAAIGSDEKEKKTEEKKKESAEQEEKTEEEKKASDKKN